MIHPRCQCPSPSQHRGPRIVLTGGPGAGKTAVLEVVRRHLCEHVTVLPEAAAIVYGGGFPRHPTDVARRAAQVSIFHVQNQLERMALGEGSPALVLCDRSVLDGVAYWPGDPAEYFAAVGESRDAMLARYAAVIHLRMPAGGAAANLRGSGNEGGAIERRLLEVWSGHPRRLIVPCEADFLDRLRPTLAFLRRELPSCCQPPVA